MIVGKASEDEINLRHLVVDIQATSNEKYIIAKLSRELQQSKYWRLLGGRVNFILLKICSITCVFSSRIA